MINEIIAGLEKNGSRTTKKKWIDKVKEHELINVELSKENKAMQVIEQFGEYTLLRIFIHKWDKTIQEEFRIIWNEDKIWGYRLKECGYSGVYAYLPFTNHMGYNDYDMIGNLELPVEDRMNYFKYIDFGDAKINIYTMLITENEYTVELLLKQGYKRAAELFINKRHYIDMKHVYKYHKYLLDNISLKKLDYANQTKTHYQRGMLKYGSYTKFDELFKVISWERFKDSDYQVIDYIDYRKHSDEFNLPKYPEDLQDAKEKLRVYLDEKSAEKDRKIYNKKFKSRELPVFKDKNIVAIPPQTVDDLKQNGVELHHCVYQYKNSYANGKTDLYIVKREEKDIATIEYSNGKLIQCRGKHNEDMTKTLSSMINKIGKYYKGLQGAMI